MLTLDLMQDHLCFWQVVNSGSHCYLGVKIIAHQHMLTIEKKNILTIGKGLTSRLDDTVIKAETEYSINITKKKCNSAIQ